MAFFVDSEIAPLRRVLIHSPDNGIERVSPNRAEEMLFDDIVYLEKMKAEHDVFKSVLECFADEVIEIEDLIFTALNTKAELRKDMLELLIAHEDLPKSYLDMFLAMDNERLLKLLVTGHDQKSDIVYFDPIPNFIFTRDIAVTVKDHLIVLKAAKEARYRENLLTRFAFLGSDAFGGEEKLINLNELEKFPPSRKGEKVSIEGGDVMMFNKDFVLIGCSERTTDHAFHSLKKEIFAKSLVKHVVQVHIPNDRYCMHIDTLFTRIDHDDLVCYAPIAVEGIHSKIVVYEQGKDDKRDYSSLKDFLLKEVNPNFRFIRSGGGESPFQEREQWTDGCNLVAMRPGIAISYDRNIKTGEELAKYGYEIITANDFLAQYQGKEIPSGKKMIIALPSGELSRARGGSHCMTCPLERAPF